jgi:hypothetical protein
MSLFMSPLQVSSCLFMSRKSSMISMFMSLLPNTPLNPPKGRRRACRAQQCFTSEAEKQERTTPMAKDKNPKPVFRLDKIVFDHSGSKTVIRLVGDFETEPAKPLPAVDVPVTPLSLC